MSDMSSRHGGPSDRGACDAYYGRTASPHKFEGATYSGPQITLTDPAEVAAYMAAYDAQDDRKDWE